MPPKIAVLGAGEMGHGIAELAALRGYRVALRDIKQEYVDRGMERIRWSLAKLVEKKEVAQGEADEALARIRSTIDLAEAVRDADWVIEAVFEDLELKKKVFSEIDAHAPSHARLASNTSGLSITAMGRVTKRPDKVVGLHFFNPVMLMALIEIVKGDDTSEETLAAAQELARTLKKTPIVCRKDVPGFITTRTIAPYMMEAAWIHDEEDVRTEVIDSALRFQVGFPMGPFELLDRVGIDLMEMATAKQGLPVPPSIVALAKAGKFGQKTGEGYYDHRQGKKPAITADLGKDFDPLRVLAPVFNEAARLLEWQVAPPETIDLAMRLGTAFPEGPLKLADKFGIDAVLAALRRSTRHAPVKLLEEMAARGDLGEKTGKGFYYYGERPMETQYDMIRVTRDPQAMVATITLNRPDRLNTINPEMVEELDRALGELERDDTIRCLVVTGAGEKAFSAGADVTSFGSVDKAHKAAGYARRTTAVFDRLAGFPKPTLAAINGYALGGGCELALACDFRVAARRAKIGQTEINLGLTTGAGGIPRLVKLLGLARAKELILLGGRLSAEEAHGIGLVTQVLENEAFATGVAEFAAKLASSAPIAYRLAKALLNHAADLPIGAALDAEAAAFGLVTSTEDIFEGIQAMMEKRPPKFKGQ
ncbi:MAG TPA: 3-hydroxyacyl-CoA dehydrogenase/enoyl-CoA hydratase family protein [Thermoplasmata archaeon]|nr:3-hydroxyacyl-CoA dehydrogenase/enoyl-CoA hydratase family protein [Thermoplasmata archaeon]